MVTRHCAQKDDPVIFTNGVQASYVKGDIDTGFVKLLKHWAVEDCGRVITHAGRRTDVQGIGGALFEECLATITANDSTAAWRTIGSRCPEGCRTSM